MTAKKKPTISGIMALEKQVADARAKYYRLDSKLDDAKNRMEEGTVEEIDGVTYIAIRKPGRYTQSADELYFVELKK